MLAPGAAQPAERGDGTHCLVTVGGSGVGAALLQRVIDAYPAAREAVPDLRMTVVCGPRIDRGALSPSQRGSMHGEVGQTQFMPKAILAYGTGNLENSANALTSTASFLKAHGWRAGAGYQPGEPNFAAIQAWNAAGVYQKAIALMGRQIDGGGTAQR